MTLLDKIRTKTPLYRWSNVEAYAVEPVPVKTRDGFAAIADNAVPVDINSIAQYCDSTDLDGHTFETENDPFPVVWFEWAVTKLNTVYGALMFRKDDELALSCFVETNGRVVLLGTERVSATNTAQRVMCEEKTIGDTTLEALLTDNPAFVAMFARELMLCKNVDCVEPEPKPGKLVKKHVKKHGFKPSAYRTIVIKPFQRRRQTPANEAPAYKKRAHLVRGHFKVYTDAAPLFGKLTGRFFCPAHVAGDPSLGSPLGMDYRIAS